MPSVRPFSLRLLSFGDWMRTESLLILNFRHLILSFKIIRHHQRANLLFVILLFFQPLFFYSICALSQKIKWLLKKRKNLDGSQDRTHDP